MYKRQTLSNTLGVTGATSLATEGGVVNIASTGVMTTVKGTLDVDEAVTLDGTLDVTGDTTLKSDVVIGEDENNYLLVNSETRFLNDVNIGGSSIKLRSSDDTGENNFIEIQGERLHKTHVKKIRDLQDNKISSDLTIGEDSTDSLIINSDVSFNNIKIHEIHETHPETITYNVTVDQVGLYLSLIHI